MKITKTGYSFKTKNFHGDIEINGDKEVWIFDNNFRSSSLFNVEEKEIDEVIEILKESKKFMKDN